MSESGLGGSGWLIRSVSVNGAGWSHFQDPPASDSLNLT